MCQYFELNDFLHGQSRPSPSTPPSKPLLVPFFHGYILSLALYALVFVTMASGSMDHHIDIEAQNLSSLPPGACLLAFLNDSSV